jgi:hypothetical protein
MSDMWTKMSLIHCCRLQVNTSASVIDLVDLHFQRCTRSELVLKASAAGSGRCPAIMWPGDSPLAGKRLMQPTQQARVLACKRGRCHGSRRSHSALVPPQMITGQHLCPRKLPMHRDSEDLTSLCCLATAPLGRSRRTPEDSEALYRRDLYANFCSLSVAALGTLL